MVDTLTSRHEDSNGNKFMNSRNKPVKLIGEISGYFSNAFVNMNIILIIQNIKMM